jgi:hypothetical protein
MSDNMDDWDGGMGADVHVSHSHIPDKVRTGKEKIVWFGHGTPENVFQTSVQNYNPDHGDCLMLNQYWLQNCDAAVTFWDRHQMIWQSMTHKNAKVYKIPMGIDKSFWHPVESQGKYAGSPSLFTAENCHQIKWPLDLFLMWPWVTEHVKDARLHVNYLPMDQHRAWFPLVNSNGAHFKSYMHTASLSHEDLRRVFASVDYYIGLVRYGDFNKICLEAKASGCKVISYLGNEYADYHIAEGDQRHMAARLIKILNGEVEANKTPDVPDISETAKAMKEIYEEIL